MALIKSNLEEGEMEGRGRAGGGGGRGEEEEGVVGGWGGHVGLANARVFYFSSL